MNSQTFIDKRKLLSDHLTSRWDLGNVPCVWSGVVCLAPGYMCVLPPGVWVRAQAGVKNTAWVPFLTDSYGPRQKTPCFRVWCQLPHLSFLLRPSAENTLLSCVVSAPSSVFPSFFLSFFFIQSLTLSPLLSSFFPWFTSGSDSSTSGPGFEMMTA